MNRSSHLGMRLAGVGFVFMMGCGTQNQRQVDLGLQVVDGVAGEANGILISSLINPGAANSSLQTNDIIMTYQGENVTSVSTLRRNEAVTPIGREVTIEVFRPETGSILDLQIGIGVDLPRSDQSVVVPSALGLSVSEVEGDGAGVLVVSVEPDTAAAEGGIEAGAVILEINGVRVSDVEVFRRQVAQISSGTTVSIKIKGEPPMDEITYQLAADQRVEVRLPVLGIEVQALSPSVAEHLGYGGLQGARVMGVLAYTPASSAGFLVGDLIIAVEGERIENAADLLTAIDAVGNRAVDIRYIRAGRRDELTVTPARSISDGLLVPNVGLRLRDRSDANGVDVLSIEANGAASAANPALAVGDVIVSVEQQPVVSVGSFNELLQETSPGDSVLVEFWRGNSRMLTVLTLPG